MNEYTFHINDTEDFKEKALCWAAAFPVFTLLDTNAYQNDKYGNIEWILAVDAVDNCADFKLLDDFISQKKSMLFGHFGYDLKNEIYPTLSSNYPDLFEFGNCFWYEPRYILKLSGNKLTINRNFAEAGYIYDAICQTKKDTATPEPLVLQAATHKAEYIEHIQKIIAQIAAGDFYELNYCCDFSAVHAIHPIAVFNTLNQLAAAPFSTLYKKNDSYLLCVSPERFLQKKENRLIAQPIKGTIQKGKDEAENLALLTALENNPKERAENIMIVDLTRNDLAKNAVAGSIVAEEICKGYSFKNINQLISTISCKLKKGSSFTNIIRATFPMGSMTGAPKLEVMKNIDRYENFCRGIYSGSVGYLFPESGDFDMNVVIRSIIYNSKTNQLNIRTGGAITYQSNPENEYAELMLKANSLCKALNAVIKE